MGSLVRVVLVIAALIIVIAVLAVPIGASQLASNLAREAGFTGSNLRVSVDLLGPATAVRRRADPSRLEGDDVGVPHGVVGHVDVTLDDVSLSDHSFSAVSGTLTGGAHQRARAVPSPSGRSRSTAHPIACARPARCRRRSRGSSSAMSPTTPASRSTTCSCRTARSRWRTAVRRRTRRCAWPATRSSRSAGPRLDGAGRAGAVGEVAHLVVERHPVRDQCRPRRRRPGSRQRADRQVATPRRRGILVATRKWWNGRHASLRSWCP